MDETSTITDVGASATTAIGVVSIITAIITVICTKGVDALLKLRKDRREDRQYDDSQIAKGYEVAVDELLRRTEKLESELKETRQQHLDCERKQAAIQGRCDVLTTELSEVREDIKRLFRHDGANKAHVELLKQAVADEQAKQTP